MWDNAEDRVRRQYTRAWVMEGSEALQDFFEKGFFEVLHSPRTLHELRRAVLFFSFIHPTIISYLVYVNY